MAPGVRSSWVDDAAGPYTKALIEGLGGAGRIVALEGTPVAPTSRDRTIGLRQALAEAPGIKLQGLGTGYFQQPPAQAEMARLLAEHAEIDGVWAANDLMAFGALEALQAAGRSAMLVGVNGLAAAIDHIERGTMLASVDFSAFAIAAIAARAALRHLAGETVPASIISFNTIRSSLLTLASIDKRFWPTSRVNTTDLMGSIIGLIQPPAGPPTPTYVPCGLMTRLYSFSVRFPTQSRMRS